MQTLLNNRTAVLNAHVSIATSRKALVVRSIATPEVVKANGSAPRARVRLIHTINSRRWWLGNDVDYNGVSSLCSLASLKALPSSHHR